MRAKKVPAALLLLLLSIVSLDANKSKQKERYKQAINICDISDRDSKVHCYCEHKQDINEAVKTECWVFNGGIEKTDPLWSSFSTQANVETLAFNVRADGALDFVPTKVFRYLRKVKTFSIKYSSIPRIEADTFSNLTTLQEIVLTKNRIGNLSAHSFSNLPNLTVLTLDENRITELVTETYYGVPALQKLYLTSNNISRIQGGAFRYLVNLQDLELDRNNISELSKECFEGLANLRRLDLRRNKIGMLNSFTFTELWNLQELLLDYNDIYGVAVRAFDGLSLLRRLSLSHNRLVSLAGGLFEGVRGLTALDLRFNKLRLFTFENLRPIYDNLKNANSFISLEGNEFSCDCHLAWMHKLRHEAKSVKVRTSLENFLCKFNPEAFGSRFINIEKQPMISSNSLAEGDDTQKDYSEDQDEIFHEEIDEAYVEEPKVVRKDDERTLLQIPVELLPCPQESKPVTDRTYTYPSQNEAKDYRNLILSSSSTQKLKVNFYLYVSFVNIYLNLPFTHH